MGRRLVQHGLRRLARVLRLRGLAPEHVLALVALTICLFGLRPPYSGIAGLVVAAVLYARLERRAAARERRARRHLARAHTELRKGCAAARAADEVKRRFLRNVSHELRTPMHGVLGMAEILLDGELPPEQREAAILLRDSAERMREGVESLLAFSAIERGRLRAEARSIALAPFLEHAVERWRERCAERGLTFTLALEPSLPAKLAVDPLFLSAALTPLLSNAVKFTARGEVRLLARADDDAVYVEVHDTGTGIGPEVRAHLFQPFFQGDDSATRPYEGLGMGLCVAAGLAACIGGQLTADDHAEGGSTFTLRVPRSAAPAPGAQPAPSAATRAQEATGGLSSDCEALPAPWARDPSTAKC